MLYYNDNNVYVGEIKQLLKNFNLPKMRVLTVPDEPLIEGLHYIKDNSIYYYNGSELKYVDVYTFGQSYFNLTTNLKVQSNIYDSYTHRYLGRYLRFLKDYYRLDLMSMYNCFSNEQLVNTKLTFGENNEHIFDYKDSAYTIYSVPVRFGQDYTIGINSTTPIEVVACFYKDGRIVKDDPELNVATYEKIRSCSFSKPYIYTKLYKPTISAQELQMEECLCLLVKVPTSCKSSIVVLEGDFRNSTKIDLANDQKLIGGLFKHKLNDETIWSGKYDYNSKLELLSYINCEGKGLLATRLIEYLSENAITKISEPYDIKKLQVELIRRGYVNSDYLGVWSNEDRQGLYRFINDFNLNSNYYDVISYLDKDVEYKLGGIV